MTEPNAALLSRFGLEHARVERIAVGLINRTYRVTTPEGRMVVLQRVNPIFSPRVHEDIDAVSTHVERHGRGAIVLPKLVPTQTGELYAEADGDIWRVLTFIDGETFERLSTAELAREAGRLLGRFHHVVSTLSYGFKNRRLGVHDTARHLATLRQTLIEKREHPRHAIIRPLAEEILDRASALPPLPPLADRVVHGDPKISNLLFERGTGRGLALVDLDTLARMPLPLELGDAFRSWCNPAGEDHAELTISLPLFSAAVEGYAEAALAFIEPAEWRAIVPATQQIMLELAARFAADALNESYFGWDPGRFATRGEHNEMRARGQLSLARSFETERAHAEEAVTRAFAR